MSKKMYLFYISLGASYPVVKVICYVNDLVYARGVIYGLIAGILTICIGMLALKEHKGATKPVGHWLAALIPLLVIPLTPIIMLIHLGAEMGQIEKVTVLAIFEAVAIAQLVLAILMFRGLIFKRGEDRLMMPAPGFMIMKNVLRVRNIFRKPKGTLREMALRKGQSVLDYGCGIGSFAIPASRMVGDDGVVYALDIHPLAIKTVEKETKKRRMSNIKTILSGRDTGLADGSVDVVLLYDVLQMIKNKDELLKELHRVLKSGGSLFVTPEHMEMSEFTDVFAKVNLFSLIGQVGKLFKFRRN
ncbi:MAG: methyltransferase domain-containing protein [Chloroflexi bacterium]|nr:methyltransferase domain-containing protein [Chloroflexota bacterium]